VRRAGARGVGPEPSTIGACLRRTARREPETCRCPAISSPPERIAVTFGGQPRVWTSPKRGPVARLERRAGWLVSKDGPVACLERQAGCQPGLTIAELRNGHVSSGRQDRSPSLQGKPWETAPEPKLGCHCRSTHGGRSCRSLLWGSCGGTLIRYALSTPGGVSPVRAISWERLATRE